MVSINMFIREVLAVVLADPDNGIVGADGATPVGAVTLTTSLPADSATYENLAYVRHITGSEFAFGRDWASITADVYAPDELAAGNIAEFIRKTFRDAQKRQRIYPSGYISRYECPVAPFPFPRLDGVSGQDRCTAQYRLLIKASA